MTSLAYRQPISPTVGTQMIFTGPDGIKDYRPKIHDFTRFIGEKPPALDVTSELRYLWRPAPRNCFTPAHRSNYVGEIGWAANQLGFHQMNLQSGKNIKLGEFRNASEKRATHRYQNPWQPKPEILDQQGAGSRRSLAWNCAKYEDIDQRNYQRSPGVKNQWRAKDSSLAQPNFPKISLTPKEIRMPSKPVFFPTSFALPCLPSSKKREA
ncbi:uncharacterized protein C4orf45 homolog [Ornithorhynchus anatinus]|uniref:Uncharacterized protein n=1 Tax=Ornithorhynchus anatinus TaxID=9258 RepID=F7EIB1_ORNAN|nr:uncharacterized protein C4orf45 homolog [Ornithorhynchus anatinus]